jgi:hypothetical protein
VGGFIDALCFPFMRFIQLNIMSNSHVGSSKSYFWDSDTALYITHTHTFNPEGFSVE